MKKIIILLCILALVGTMAVSAATLETDHPCGLTLHYARGENLFADLPIAIYLVAEFDSNGNYTATEQFAGYPVKIHNIENQSQWQEAADTLVSCIVADGLAPTVVENTDESGDVVFSDLTPGLYLVLGADVATDSESFRFQPFFVFLPTPVRETDTYLYDIEANPKPGQITPHTEYTVVKLWKDKGAASRPVEIIVDIFCDGELQETVTLSKENDWSYTWLTGRTDGVWTVAERNVPKGYTVTVTSRENVFTIVNTTDTTQQNRPGTGDTAPVELYVMTACVSGMLLLIMGVWFKRKWA